MTLFARLYAAVLASAPPAFRERFAQEAVDLAVERLRETPAPRKPVRAVRELIDALRTVRTERRAALHSHVAPHVKGSLMDAFTRDIRLAVRGLLRAPAFSLLAIVTLAIGIGGTALMLTTVNAAFLQPLPFGEPDRLVQLWQVGQRSSSIRIALPTWRDWQSGAKSLSLLAASAGEGPATAFAGGEPERVVVASVSRNFFDTLGVPPHTGRAFSRQEAEPNGPPAVVISDAAWEHFFGRASDVLAKTIAIDGEPHPVVGVAPAGFSFPAGTDMWVTFEREEDHSTRTAHNIEVIGRLAPGVTVESAGAELAAVTRAMHAVHADMAREGHGVRVVSLREQLLGGAGRTVGLMFGAVALVLLIGCANVVNLLLARSASRESQMVLRLAIGASRAAVVRICVLEGLVLAIAGGALGALLMTWASSVAEGLVPSDLLQGGALEPSVAVIAGVAALLVVVGGLCGLVSAWQALRAPLRGALAAGSRSADAEPMAMRVLVGVEVALAVMLLAGAGLLMRSLIGLERIEPGFRREGAVVSTFSLGSGQGSPYAVADARARFFDQLLEGLKDAGGLGASGVTSSFPFGFSANASLEEEGVALQDSASGPSTHYRVIGGEYFKAMGVRLVAGRTFDTRDQQGSAHVAIVNEPGARLLGGTQSALGRRVRMQNVDSVSDFAVIVGVVSGVRHAGIARQPYSEVFFPYQQRPRRTYSMTLVAESDLSLAAVAPQVREIVRQIDPGVPVRLERMEDRLGLQLAAARFRTRLLVGFAAIATLLAMGGIFGVVSYGVARRTREIGIRLALGAQRSAVRRLVLRRALVPVLIGAAAGVVGALLGGRLLTTLIFEVSATDPLTFASSVGILLASAVLGAFLPAARATKVDPLTALRHN